MGPVKMQLIFLLTFVVFELTFATSYGTYKRNNVNPASVHVRARDRNNGCWSVYVQCTDYFTQQYNIVQRDMYDFLTSGQQYKKILKIIAEHGMDTLCQNIDFGRNCYSIQSTEKNCWNDSRITNPYELFDLQDYLCEDNVKNDLKQRWDCFFNPKVFQRLEKCMVYFRNSTRFCDPRPMESCIEEMLDTSSQCQAGAGRVAKQVITRVLFFLNHCAVKDSACKIALSDCSIFPLQLYTIESPYDTALKTSGPGEFCRDLLRSRACAVETERLETCAYLRTAWMAKPFKVVVNLPEYICVEERAALEEHWDCLKDSQAQQDIKLCEKHDKSGDHCRISHIKKCITEAISSYPACKPGAENLIAHIQMTINNLRYLCDHYYPDGLI